MRSKVTICTWGSSCSARFQEFIFPIWPPCDAQNPEFLTPRDPPRAAGDCSPASPHWLHHLDFSTRCLPARPIGKNEFRVCPVGSEIENAIRSRCPSPAGRVKRRYLTQWKKPQAAGWPRSIRKAFGRWQFPSIAPGYQEPANPCAATVVCTVTGASSNAVWLTATLSTLMSRESRFLFLLPRGKPVGSPPTPGNSPVKSRGVPNREQRELPRLAWHRRAAPPPPANSAPSAEARHVEIQFAKVPRALQTRIQRVAPHLKIFLERPLPALRIGDQLFAQQITPRTGLAGVLYLQALAVVGHQGEDIRAGTRALAGPKRFQQAQRQRGDTGWPILSAPQTIKNSRFRNIAPGRPNHCAGQRGQHDECGSEPGAIGQNDGGKMGHCGLPNFS